MGSGNEIVFKVIFDLNTIIENAMIELSPLKYTQEFVTFYIATFTYLVYAVLLCCLFSFKVFTFTLV